MNGSNGWYGSHRLSTIVNADEILVLKKGEIIERGTHKQLLETRGEYHSMWEMQAREAEEANGNANNNNNNNNDNNNNNLLIPPPSAPTPTPTPTPIVNI